MIQRPKKAADYLDLHAIEVSVILAELAESAGIAGRAWALALAAARENPERALEHLATAEVQLHSIARIEVSESLRRIRAAMDRFDREMPEEHDVTAESPIA
jgi:hypothetical protein